MLGNERRRSHSTASEVDDAVRYPLQTQGARRKFRLDVAEKLAGKYHYLLRFSASQPKFSPAQNSYI